MPRGTYYLLDVSMKAGEDLSEKQYYFMKISAADVVVTNDTADASVYGVLQDKPEEDAIARIRVHGTSRCIAGGSIPVNAYIASDADGKGVAVTPALGGTSTLHSIRGIALSGATTADDVFEVFLTHIIAKS